MWLIFDTVNKSLGSSITGPHLVCKHTCSVYFHLSYTMPFCPHWPTSEFPLFELWWSQRSDDKLDLLFALVVEKCWICFFFWRMFGICCYLSRVLHTVVKLRCSGSQAHNGTRLSAVSLRLLPQWEKLVSQGGGPADKICFAGRKGNPASTITSTGDMEVMISVWMDVLDFHFPHTETPFKKAFSSSCIKISNRDQWPQIDHNCTWTHKHILISINVPVYINNFHQYKKLENWIKSRGKFYFDHQLLALLQCPSL